MTENRLERKRGKHRTKTRHAGMKKGNHLTDKCNYGTDNCNSGTEKGRFGTGTGGPSGSPRGPGEGLVVPWEALGESQGGFSDTRRSLWGPRGARLNFRGGLGGAQGATVNQGVVLGSLFRGAGRNQNINKATYFMYIFAMG